MGSKNLSACLAEIRLKLNEVEEHLAPNGALRSDDDIQAVEEILRDVKDDVADALAQLGAIDTDVVKQVLAGAAGAFMFDMVKRLGRQEAEKRHAAAVAEREATAVVRVAKKALTVDKPKRRRRR